MNSVHFFLFSPFGCCSGAFFGQIHPLLGTPNFFFASIWTLTPKVTFCQWVQPKNGAYLLYFFTTADFFLKILIFGQNGLNRPLWSECSSAGHIPDGFRCRNLKWYM